MKEHHNSLQVIYDPSNSFFPLSLFYTISMGSQAIRNVYDFGNSYEAAFTRHCISFLFGISPLGINVQEFYGILKLTPGSN